MQFLVANYHGPWLVDVAGGLVSLVCLALFLRVWQPRHTWHFPDETAASPQRRPSPTRAAQVVVAPGCRGCC